jgi:hypothetical protein
MPAQPLDERAPDSVQLPEGVTAQQWADEKARWQNPRIRALLGCSAMLENVQESNQAILSCSPERLDEIWAAVREVARLLSDELVPLLEGPSHIPALEAARRRTRFAGSMILSTVVDEIERMPATIEQERNKEFRKLLCVAFGQIDDFLQNAFAELMANDPRSFIDSGYFLSRRFRRDVSEAEWLLTTVDRLVVMLGVEGEARPDGLHDAVSALGGRTAPSPAQLEPMVELVRGYAEELTPRLKEIAALRGIRFAELEVVERWAADLPVKSEIVLEVLELWKLVRAPLADGGGGPQPPWLAAMLARMRDLLLEIDGLLLDVRAFLPLWRQSIGNRRALAFRRL